MTMEKSVFYKSYFADVSSISHIDDSQLILETKIPKVKSKRQSDAHQKATQDASRSKAKPVTFNGISAAKQTRQSVPQGATPNQIFRRRSPQADNQTKERISLA